MTNEPYILTGEGRTRTTLYFPKSMNESQPTPWANNQSPYTYGPGYINFDGSNFVNDGTYLATVTQVSSRLVQHY